MNKKHMANSMPNPERRALTLGRLSTVIATISLLLGASADIIYAQSLWTGSNVVWGTSGAWSPAGVPNSVDAVVNFNNTTNPVANGSGAYTFGTINLTATSGSLGLAGASTVLTPQVSSGVPIINVNNGSSLYWYFTTAGTQGFTKLGGGTLTSRFNNTPNTFSGPVIVGQGGLQLQLGGSLANVTSLTISNAAAGGLSLANSANASATGFGNIYTILPATLPIKLEGGGAPVIQVNYIGQTLVIPGSVLSSSGSGLYYKGPGTAILSGANTYNGLTTVSGGTLITSTTSTGAGSYTVFANATNGVQVAAAGTSLVMSNLTLVGTNNSVLSFSPGVSGVPTTPVLNVTNQLMFVTNVPAPLYLTGGGWQTGSGIPLLHFGTLVNTNPSGVLGSFALGTLPQGFTAAISDGTSTNQINLNLTSIVPLVWNPSVATANWTASGNWSLSAVTGKTYSEVAGMGSSVQFDDSLAPVGPSILVTNNSVLAPNNVVFNSSTHNYTLLGSGSIANNASLTKSGSSYLTNSLANSYFGSTFLNGGVMVLNNATALGYGGQIIFNGGTLQFSANNTIDYSSRFSQAINQAYMLNLGGQKVSLGNALTSSGGSLTVQGAGTLTLGASASYTGATTNAAGTLKLGVNNAIPATTALTLGGNGTAGTLDLAGYSQQIAALALDPSATGATITNSSTVSDATLVFKGGTSTFAGKILSGIAGGSKSLGLTVGSGSLTLTGANTYQGNTTITNGSTLIVGSGSISSSNVMVGTGSTFDVSAISYATVLGGNLSGVGNVNGNVEVVFGSALAAGFYGATTNHGSLTFNNSGSSLTLDVGATASFHVDTTAASANNDNVVVSGYVYANGNSIYLTALNGATSLATGTDYTLISSANPISGSFNTSPIWLGTAPANHANFSVVTSGNTVKLHYNSAAALSGVGTATPASGVHQNYVISVQVTPGTLPASTGIGVTVDLSSLGGSSSQVLTGVGGNLFTYTYAVPGSITPALFSLPFTVSDAQTRTYAGNIALTVGTGIIIWNGAAADNNWSSQNWANGAVPDSSGDAGDSLLFAGATRLSPVMDSSFNATGVTFSNNAGAFNITTTGGSLTLAASSVVENQSTTAENLNVPLNLTSGTQFKATAGDLTVGAIGGSGGFTKTGNGKLTVDGTSGTCSFSGNVSLAGGTLAIFNADNVLPTTAAVACTAPATFDLGGHSQTLANFAVALGVTNVVKNGSLTVTAGNFNPFNGLSAASTLDMSGLINFTYTGANFYPQGSVTSGPNLSQVFSVYLAGSGAINSITANLFEMGLNGNTAIPVVNLYLGQTNLINVTTFQTANYRGNGNIYMQSGLINPIVVLRAQDGVSSLPTMNIGAFSSGVTVSSTVDFGLATVDGLVTTINLCSSTLGSGVTQTGTLNFGNGSFNIGTLNLATSSSAASPAATLVGNFDQTGGTNVVQTINFGVETSTGSPVFKPSYTVGKGATLQAAMMTSTAAYAAGTIRDLNLNGGTLTTYDSSTDLTISGVDGTSGGVINLVLGAGTTNTFFADTGRLIDLQSTTVVSGSGHLKKTGSGNLFLEGVNTFTGNTTVSAGTLEIAQATIAPLSTVTVASGALLQLDFAVTNQVAALIINGFSKAPGVYKNSTDPSYITGTGSLLVVPISTNAYLTSLALNPTDNMTPAFMTNGYVYYATNGIGVTPTVTVTNGNQTATNVLILNGVTLQVLNSGVPSLAVTNFGAGSTNVLSVLVTAQDGVTTKLYTINVTQLAAAAVNTNSFAIGNSVSSGNLNLSWPPDRLGWGLYVQTNTLSTGLGTNWFLWPNSTTVTNVSIPINPANPSVFYRMNYTP